MREVKPALGKVKPFVGEDRYPRKGRWLTPYGKTALLNAQTVFAVLRQLRRFVNAIAARLGMPQSNVSRIEHSEVITFNTFASYLFACGFDFKIDLQPVVGFAPTW